MRTFGDDKLTKWGIALSPDGKCLLSEEYIVTDHKRGKGELRLWDVAGGKEIWRKDLVGTAGPLAISADGKRFAASINGDPSEIQLCEMATGNVLRSFISDSRPQCLSFSSDGSLLAAGMADGTALTWDVSK